MKNRIMTLCLITCVATAFIACCQQKKEDVEETAPIAVQETVEEGAITENVAEEDDEQTQDNEDDYTVFTSKSSEEVEEYAKNIKEAALAEDWETIGAMIAYPIGSEKEGNLCETKEDFIDYEQMLALLRAFMIHQRNGLWMIWELIIRGR